MGNLELGACCSRNDDSTPECTGNPAEADIRFQNVTPLRDEYGRTLFLCTLPALQANALTVHAAPLDFAIFWTPATQAVRGVSNAFIALISPNVFE
jgi:hypothetical protein